MVRAMLNVECTDCSQLLPEALFKSPVVAKVLHYYTIRFLSLICEQPGP